ncbi:MFS transporter [Pedobacter insulae]|uniref:Predicted arabinose efflux permease, MFS family n=1 Tax=Pedobacter insulae TaxID=414048 RepID=A0A1I2ZAP2_9SPHI|nr:MFS transporter [Pedobacter insulae]SFH34844.1 Predicted arabinose efflux permease, MFS family [Pedobacter insulae]
MRRILPIIVIAQFFCTSIWFGGNAVMDDIAVQFNLSSDYLAYLTNSVQAGFITGTLLFAILGIADRFSPVKIFFICACVAAAFNLMLGLNGTNLSLLFICRFFTGFFLAGIYPIGMKIAADHYEKGLGKSLGFLVGALVLGTAFPHFLKSGFATLPWKYVIFTTSVLSLAGGAVLFSLVPDGPYRKPGQQLKLGAFRHSFKNNGFRAAAFGYFGHMWELYTFWVFIPVMLANYNYHYQTQLNVPLLSFFIIVMGSLACVGSGLLANRFGTKRLATLALAISGICCLLSPIFLQTDSITVLVIFLMIWSMAVIADSPLFSTLVAQNVSLELKGSSLTIVNCIGFSITIVSIQLINIVMTRENAHYIFVVLALGPLFGLYSMLKNSNQDTKST